MSYGGVILPREATPKEIRRKGYQGGAFCGLFIHFRVGGKFKFSHKIYTNNSGPFSPPPQDPQPSPPKNADRRGRGLGDCGQDASCHQGHMACSAASSHLAAAYKTHEIDQVQREGTHNEDPCNIELETPNE